MDVLGPLTLRPGDRRIRAVVRDAPPTGDPWWVERSCARCSRVVDAATGAQVVYGPHHSTMPDTAALCSNCAAALTPFRFAVDPGRLPPSDDSAAMRRAVAELVQRIVAMRAEPSTDAVWIRAEDVHGLARRLATTRTHLAMRLRDLGLLVAVEVATTHRPGTARRSPQRHLAQA